MSDQKEAAEELGRRLLALRLENGLTLEALSESLQYGGKGTLSECERGKRVPSVALLRAYVKLGGNADELLKLRARAVAKRARSAALESLDPVRDAGAEAAAPSSTLHAAALLGSAVSTARAINSSAYRTDAFLQVEPNRLLSSQPRRRGQAISVGVLLVVAALVVGVIVHLRSAGQPSFQARIVRPTVSADYISVVTGTAAGVTGRHLWLATRTGDDPHLHPTEQPLTIVGTSWTWPDLYLGQPHDTGKRFDLLLLASEPGNAGDQTLVDYANRPKGTPDEYVGLPGVPAQVQVVDRVILIRR